MVVVGTLNLDIVLRVARMPDVGETVLGRSRNERPGGKGGNQAAAAAASATTALIGAVGTDDAADLLLTHQRRAGVDITHVRRVEGISGQAVIEVDDAGDNRIVVLPGANAALDAVEVTAGLDDLDPAIVLTQLESPRAVTAATADWCLRRDRRFLLNPSPTAPLDDDILAVADPLVVNQHEAAFYGGGGSGAGDVERLARELLTVSRSAVITLGGDGVIVADRNAIHRIPVMNVHTRDTTGAGDHFAGTLAAHLSRGAPLLEASEHAAAAATKFVGGEPS